MSKQNGKLKLFVWDTDDVLRDYSTGLICVLAHSLEEALKMIREKSPNSLNYFQADRFRIVEKPEAFMCWGSS